MKEKTMTEKCDKNVKVVIHLVDTTCEFKGRDLREVINLIEKSVQHISKLEEVVVNFINKCDAIVEEKYR